MRRSAGLILFAALLLSCTPAFAEKTLQTEFTTIHYSDDSYLSDFLWRITGKRLNGEATGQLTRNRVDEIVEKVISILDMRPSPFRFDIYLEPHQSGGTIAFYSHERRAIIAVYNRVTDGVLAHEIAHAVMNAYFGTVPPEKTQEILAQYVDQNLWSEVA